MDKSKRKHDTGKVYKPEGRQYWGIVVLIAIIGLHFALTSTIFREASWLLNGIIFTIYALVLFSFFIQAARTSIIIHEDGLEYRYGSSYTFSTWDNLKYINKYGIYFHQAIEPVVHGGFIEKLLFRKKAISHIRIANIVNIPTRWVDFRKGLVIDLEKFGETEFGEDLMYYAPHLLKPYTDKKLKNRLEDENGTQEMSWYEDEIMKDWEGHNG